jgi:hypothetical protein
VIQAKPGKRTAKGDSLTPKNGALSAAPRTVRSMIYWLEKISPDDIARLWNELRVSAKGAKRRTISGRWVSGITRKADSRVAAIVYTTPHGFVLHFTAELMSKSDGRTKP